MKAKLHSVSITAVSCLLLVTVLVFSIFLATSKKASALVGSEFIASRITDDSIFFNGYALDTTTIQNFLNSKVPACDTNGTQAYGGTTRAAYAASKGVSTPFTCLKDYRQDVPARSAEANLCNGISAGNKSAAQIIFEVGRSCNVSQASLIVLLQKEQSLITDDWPWPIQYRSATGYGCPDTAPCDAEYYGFFNQVYSAARQFKNYALNPNRFNFAANRTNYVGYHPNTACGGGNQTIQNNATAGLYNFTPYQPNQAALNNLYGSGDGCSSYGNRNYWRLYNDWFGPTITGWKPSTVYKGVNGSQLFMVWDGVKYYIPNYDVMIAWNIHRSPVNIVADSYLDGLPSGNWLSNIVKASDNPSGPLFLLDDGKRFPVSINDCKYDLSGQPITNTTWGLDCFNATISKDYPEQMLLRNTAADIPLPQMIAFGESVWKMEGGKKRRIVDGLIIDVLGGWGKVRWMKDLNALQPQGKIVMRNDFVIRFSNSGAVYLFDGEQLNPVPGLDEYFAWGLDKLPTIVIPAEWNSSDPLPVGGALTVVAKDVSDQYFLIDKGYKLPFGSVTPQWPTSSPTTTTPAALARLRSIPLSDVFLSDRGEIFTVYASKRYIFATMDDFFQLGFRTETIRRVSNNVTTLPGLSYGGLHLANGRLYKVSNNVNQIYRVNGSTSQYVNSINYPGLPYSKLITVDTTTAARYPVAGTYTP